jgi:hypothetical protein
LLNQDDLFVEGRILSWQLKGGDDGLTGELGLSNQTGAWLAVTYGAEDDSEFKITTREDRLINIVMIPDFSDLTTRTDQ